VITLGEGLHPDVPMDTYHGNCCPGPSVSGSVLFTLHETCPARALAKHYLSPWPREEDDTEAKDFGTAAGVYLVEGPEAFAERFVVKPEDMSFSTKEGKAWRAANEGRELVSFAEFEKIKGMAIGLQQNEGTAAAFTEGRPEVTGIYKDPETGIYLKSRPDWLRPGLAINYKTAKSAAKNRFMRQAWDLGYFVSAAVCVDVMKGLGQPVHYCLLPQEKKVPYLSKAYVLTDDYLQGGRMIYRRALQKFADSLAAGKWEGYGDEVGTLPYPPWAERILADINSPF